VAREAARNASFKDYDAFVADTNAIFAGLRAARVATEGDVARVIFEAATDGTNQLRYLATADIAPLVKARRETSEPEYIALMRSQFMPKDKPHRDMRDENHLDFTDPLPGQCLSSSRRSASFKVILPLKCSAPGVAQNQSGRN